jgi:uncharacterized protein YqhQ
MTNPETPPTLGTRHGTNSNKTKNTTQKAKKMSKTMLAVSLDWSFLIALSVFSNFYLFLIFVLDKNRYRPMSTDMIVDLLLFACFYLLILIVLSYCLYLIFTH